MCTRTYAMYTKEQFTRKRSSFVLFVRSFRSFIVYIRAHTYTQIHACTHTELHATYAHVCALASLRVRPARTYGFLHFMIYRAAFNGPQSVLKARRLIKEIIEDAK